MLNKNNKTLQLAAWAVLIAAVLHLAAAALLGGQEAIALLVIGVVYIIIARAMSTERRWLSYLTFICMLIGTSLSISRSFDSPVFALMAVAEITAWILLFMHLWKAKPVRSF